MIGSLQMNLFSLIASRIEGTVVDEETGQPIVNAEVYLAHDSEKVNLNVRTGQSIIPYQWEKKTNNQGYFKFDNLIESDYLVCVFKEEYVTVGPFRKEFEYKSRHSLHLEKYRKSLLGIDPGTKGLIHLKEGEIKHFEIKLAREAVVEVRYTMKTHKGIGPVLPIATASTVERGSAFSMNIGAKLYFEDLDQVIPPTKKKIGLVRFENLPGRATVKVEVWALGYPNKTYELRLEKGVTSIVDHILDYTKGPVVYGVIKDKSNGEYIDLASIYLYDSMNNQIRTYSNFNGEYWLGGFISGDIIIKIRFQIPSKSKEDILTFNIKQNEIRELNLEY